MIPDLSAFVIAGRVKAQPSPESDTAARTPAQGVNDGVEAERIGFRRIFLSERWNLKEAGSLLGGIAARTSRIDVATGVIPPDAWHPLHAAALGSTIHAAYGPRFVLGLGRGDDEVMGHAGMGRTSFRDLKDYVDIIRRLWAGETITYDGPVGKYPNMAMGDVHDGPDPKIWFGTIGLEKAAKTAAECMDGVLLVPNLTPEATAGSVARIRAACEEIGRDPASIRIAQCLVTAPELDEVETAQIADARLYTYLQAPGYGKSLAAVNGWDPGVIDKLADHEQMKGDDAIADARFHRSELLGPASNIPREWVHGSCAIGTVEECLKSFEAFRAAGADEIVTYGSTPGQNEKLAHAWAERSRKSA